MAGAEAVAEMFGYFAGVIEERRRHPQDDLIGALISHGGGCSTYAGTRRGTSAFTRGWDSLPATGLVRP